MQKQQDAIPKLFTKQEIHYFHNSDLHLARGIVNITHENNLKITSRFREI